MDVKQGGSDPMGKWKKQPHLPPGLPSETRQVERALEVVEQENAGEVAREEALIEQGIVPPITYPPEIVIPVPEPVIPPVPPYECSKKPFLYVAAHVGLEDESGALLVMYIIDPEEGAVVKTVPFDPLDQHPYVMMVYDPVHQRIFLTSPPPPATDIVTIFDVETDEFIATIATGEYAMIVGVDPARNVLYVPLSLNPEGIDIAIIDLSTLQVIATLSFTGVLYARIAWVEPQTGTVYIYESASPNDKLWKMDPDTYQVTLVREIEISAAGWSAADMTHGKIYISGYNVANMPSLASFDIQTESVQIHEIPELGLIGIDERTGNVLLIGEQTIYVVDPVTFAARLLATIDMSESYTNFISNSIIYDNILYTLTFEGTIYGLDLDTGAEVFKLALDINGRTYNLVVAPRCIEWEV
jgi:hypothetical protein